MYGETVGFAVAPSVALAYATVAAFLFALSRMPADGPALAAQPERFRRVIFGRVMGCALAAHRGRSPHP